MQSLLKLRCLPHVKKLAHQYSKSQAHTSSAPRVAITQQQAPKTNIQLLSPSFVHFEDKDLPEIQCQKFDRCHFHRSTSTYSWSGISLPLQLWAAAKPRTRTENFNITFKETDWSSTYRNIFVHTPAVEEKCELKAGYLQNNNKTPPCFSSISERSKFYTKGGRHRIL